MEEMETEVLTPEQIYRPGDVVWVKISGMWWPAEVKDQTTLDPEITEGLKKQPLAVVQFLKEDTYEHIKSLDHIYHYVCKRKEEFLKLGFKKYYRLKNEKNMAMYPESIQEAERRTGGDPEIIHDPKILPQEVQEPKMENGGRKSLPANFKTKKGWAPRRSAPAQSGDGDVTGDGDNEEVVRPVKLEKQGPSWYPYPHHMKYIATVRKPPKDDLPAPFLHRCSLCCFETTNFEVLLMHHRYNQHNTTLMQPSKYHWRNPLNRSDKKTKLGSGIKKNVVRKKKDSIKPLEKRHRKKKKDLPPVPAGEFTPPKKSKLSSPLGTPSALEVSQECAKIIEEWTDDEDETKTNDATYGDDIDCSASTNDNTVDVTAEIAEPCKDSEHQQNTSGATLSKMDKPSAPSKAASCFDFDDEEPAEPDLQSLKFGQKLPRVITPEKSKPPDPLREGDDIDDLLKEVSVPEIPSLPPSRQDSVYSRGDRTYGSSPFKDAKKSAATSPDKAKSDADANTDCENNKNEEKHFLVEGPLQSKKRKSSGHTEGAEDGSAFNKKLKGVSPKKPSNEEVVVAEVANKESLNIADESRAAELAKQSLIDTLTYSPKPEEKTIEDENVFSRKPGQIENDNVTPNQDSSSQVEDKCQIQEKAETLTDIVVAEKKSPASEPTESPKSKHSQSVRTSKSGRRSQLVGNSVSKEPPLEVETPPQAQRPQRKSSDESRVEDEKHELLELSDAPPPDPDKVKPSLDISNEEVPQAECLVSPSSLNKNKATKYVSPASSLTNRTLNEESMENQVNESPHEVLSVLTADIRTMKEKNHEVSRQSKSQPISSRKSHRHENQLPLPAHVDDMVCEGMSKTEKAEPGAPLRSPIKSPTGSIRRSKRSKIDDSQGMLEQAKPTETAEPRKSAKVETTTNSFILGSSADEPLKSPSMPSRRSSRNKSLHSEEIVEPLKSPKNDIPADEALGAIGDPDIEPSPTSVKSKRNKTVPHESTEVPSLLEDGTLKKEPSSELKSPSMPSRRSSRNKSLHSEEIVEPLKSPKNDIPADEALGAIGDPDIEPSPTSVKSKRNKTVPHESTEVPSLLEDGTLKKEPSSELNERDKSTRRSVKAKPHKEVHLDEIIEPKEVADRKNDEDSAKSKVSCNLIEKNVADVLPSPVVEAVKSPPKSGRKSERSKPGSASPGKVEQGKLIGVVDDRITEDSKAPIDTPESLKSPSLPSRRSTRNKSAHSEDTAEPIKSSKANDVPGGLAAEAHAIQSCTKSIRMSKQKKSIGQEHTEVQSLPEVEVATPKREGSPEVKERARSSRKSEVAPPKREASPEVKERARSSRKSEVAPPKREASPEVKERTRSSRKSKKFKSLNETSGVLDMELKDPTSGMEVSPQVQLESIEKNKTVSEFEEANLLDHPQDIADPIKTPDSHVNDNLSGCMSTEITSSDKLPNSKLLPLEESNSIEPSSVDQAPNTENVKDIYESPRRSRRNQSSRAVEVTEPEIDHAKVIPAEVPKQSLDPAISSEPPLKTSLMESTVLDSSVSPSKNATSPKMLGEVEGLKEVEPPSKGLMVPQDKAEDSPLMVFVQNPSVASIHEQSGSQSVDETAKVLSAKDVPKLAINLISEAELGKDSPTNRNKPRHFTTEPEPINVTPGDNTGSSSDLINSANMSSGNESVHLEIASSQRPEVVSNDRVVTKELGEDSEKSELAQTSDIVLDSAKVKEDILGDKNTTELPSTAETPSPLVEESEASKSNRHEDKPRKSTNLLDKKKKDSDSSSHVSARETQGSRKRENKLKRSSPEERFRESREASSKKRGGKSNDEVRGKEAPNLKGQEKSRSGSKSSSKEGAFKEKDKKESKQKEDSSSKVRHSQSSRKEKEIERVKEKTDRSSHRRSSRRSIASSQPVSSDAAIETSEKYDTHLAVKASKELIGKSEANHSKTSKRPSEDDPFAGPTKTPEKKENASPKKPSELRKRSSRGASNLGSRSEESKLNEEEGRTKKGDDSCCPAPEISGFKKEEAVTTGVVGNLEHPSKLSIDATKDALQIQSEDLPRTELPPTDQESKTCISSAANVNESPTTGEPLEKPLEKAVVDSIKGEITVDTNLAPSPEKRIIHSPSKTFRHDEAASLLEELLGSSPKSSPASSPKKVKADSPLKQVSPRRSEHSKDVGNKFLLSPSKVLGLGSPSKVVESNSDSTEQTPSKSPESVFSGLSATPVRASRWDNPNLSVKSLAVSPTKAPRSPGSKLKVEILSGSRVKSSPPETKNVASDAPHVPSLEPDSSSHQSDDELSALQAEILSYSAMDKASSAAASEEKKDLQLAKDLGSEPNSILSQLSTSLARSPSKKSSVQSEPLISPLKSVGSLRAGPATPSSMSEAAELANILKGDEEPFTQESICSGAPVIVSASNLSDTPATVNVVDVPFHRNVQAESFGSELLDIISMPIIFASDEGESLLPTADAPETVTETVSSTAPLVPVVSSITLPSTDGPPVKSAPTGKVLTTSVAAPEPVHSTSSPPDPIPGDVPELTSGDVPEQELIETEIIMDHSETELQTLETPAQTQEPANNSQYPSWLRPDIHEFLSKGAVEKKVYRARKVTQMVIGIYDENHPDYNYYMSLPPCTVGTCNFKESWADATPTITKPAPKPPTMLSSKMSLSSTAKPAGINSKLVTSNSNQLSAAARQALSVDKSKAIVTVARPETVGAEVVLASSPAKNSPVRIVTTQVPINIVRQQGASPSRPASSRVKQDVLTSLEKLKAGQLDPQMKNKLVGLANDPEVLAKLKGKNVSQNLIDVKVAPKNVIVSSANIPIMRSSPAKSILIPTTSSSQPKNILVAAAQGTSQPKNKVVLAGNPEIKFTIQQSFRKMTLASNSPKIVVANSPGEKQPIVMARNITRTQSTTVPGPSAIRVTQAPQRPLLVQGVKGQKPSPNSAQKVTTQTIRFKKPPVQVPARTVQRPSKPETYTYVTLANNTVIPTGSDKTIYVVSGANKPAPALAPGSDILAEALGNIGGILPSDSDPFTEEPSQDLFSTPPVVIAGSLGADQLSNISFEADR